MFSRRGTKRELPRSELGKSLGGGLERRFLFAKREAKMVAALGAVEIEAGSRDGGDADVRYQIFCEGHVIGESEGGNVRHDVVGAARFEAFETGARQNPEQAVAPRQVLGRNRLVIA